MYTKDIKPSQAWSDLKQRCLNKRNKNYKQYGARGIRIHPKWISSRASFIAYLKTLPNYNDYISSPTLSIDRINNNLGYVPENIKFSNNYEQNRNRTYHPTKITGVSLCKERLHLPNPYKARISINNKNKHIGYYKTQELAVTARNTFIKENNLRGYKIQ